MRRRLAGSRRSCSPAAPVRPRRRAEPRAAAVRRRALCREHGVLEAVCTQVQSQARPGVPGQGGLVRGARVPRELLPDLPSRARAEDRPAEVVAAEDEPPADRLKVRLASPQMARVVGIDTEKARPLAGPDGFVVPARLSYDASRRAEVNARSAGVVRSVLVDLGSRVRRGDALVVLESAEVGADRSRLAAARAREDVARAALRAGARAAHRGDHAQARGGGGRERAGGRKRRGAGARGGRRGGRAGGSSSRYTLQAPLPGIVVRRLATVGRQVDSEEVLLEIADASVLWAEIDVPERHLPEVAVGQRGRPLLRRPPRP